jgi:hypothetical protein
MIIVRKTIFLSAVLMAMPLAKGSNYTYAGNDVNADRRDSRSGSWNSVDIPTARQTTPIEPKTLQNLNQFWQWRKPGSSRTQKFRNFRSSGGRFRG